MSHMLKLILQRQEETNESQQLHFAKAMELQLQQKQQLLLHKAAAAEEGGVSSGNQDITPENWDDAVATQESNDS